MGGQAPKSPPPKPFPGGIKKARTMLKLMRSALRTTSAKKKLADASTGEGAARMQALGPVIDGLTRGTCEKYGFQEAMQSISAEGGKTRDENIREQLEDLGEIITGEKSPSKLKKELKEALAEIE